MAQNYVERPALCVGPCQPRREDGSGGPRRTMAGSALCEVCAEHFADNLHFIADDWEALEMRIARSDARSVGEEMVDGSRQSYGLSLNGGVVQLRSEVSGWTFFLGRTVLDETTAAGPTDDSVPGILRWVAQWHANLIVNHEDAALVAAITLEARDHRRAVFGRAYPADVRRIDLPSIKCRAIDADSDGQRWGCGGHMYAMVGKKASEYSDMICTETDEHRVQPSHWNKKLIDRIAWVEPVAAAVMLGTNRNHVYALAKREKWARKTFGATVRYLEEDVRATAEKRELVGAGA